MRKQCLIFKSKKLRLGKNAFREHIANNDNNSKSTGPWSHYSTIATANPRDKIDHKICGEGQCVTIC